MEEPMSRSEALSLIQRDLNTIVPYLKSLESAIFPVFAQKGVKLFEVSVDLVGTAAKGSLDYVVGVYNQRGLSEQCVREAVRQADPNYNGRINIIPSGLPYPIDAALNRLFLEDLMESQR